MAERRSRFFSYTAPWQRFGSGPVSRNCSHVNAVVGGEYQGAELMARGAGGVRLDGVQRAGGGVEETGEQLRCSEGELRGRETQSGAPARRSRREGLTRSCACAGSGRRPASQCRMSLID